MISVGVFDSGIGGEAVAAKLKIAFPDFAITTVNDKEHLPYGTKTQTEIISLTTSAIQPLIKKSCDVIILACNTATSVAITSLRTTYPAIQFIGLEPMVKTASSLTMTGIIAICATPATLQSARYSNLKKSFGSSLQIIEPDCSSWASMIESKLVDKVKIETEIAKVKLASADVIVLGCTHYHWISELISSLAGNDIKILEPTAAAIRRLSEITHHTPVKEFADCINCSPLS